MNFREYANTETSALIERLTAAADAATHNAIQEVRSSADAEIERLRADVDGLRQDADKQGQQIASLVADAEGLRAQLEAETARAAEADRKSTRLNSSHGYISYAVFCLNKKT